MTTLETKKSEEEVVEKCEKIIKSCVSPGQMKTSYNFICQAGKTGLIGERYLTYLHVLYEKKASEMECI